MLHTLFSWLPRSLPVLLAVTLAAAACGDSGDEGVVFHTLLGGETTALSDGKNAFELSARNLTNESRRAFEVGDSFFTQNWVAAPASTDARDGLGPLHSAVSCSSCHSHDGRAKPPDGPDDPERGIVFRLSVPGAGGPLDDPNYGGALQDRAIMRVAAEGRIAITYEEVQGEYPDGTPYSLRYPVVRLEDLAYGPLHPDVMTSLRIAPAIIGMGLLEAIPEADILTLADPDDADGNGISGRPNYVTEVRTGNLALGRIGWKSNQPTIEQQVGAAFLGDIGITSTLFPVDNCTAPQQACLSAPNGGSPEIPDARLDRVTFYVQTLAVPAMRNVDDPQVRRGARLFVETQCAACHTPKHVTGDTHPIAELRGQTIFPYTDLLLHDMGEGLADNRPDGLATGTEWRTPPLWGIGLVETVSGHTMFLHDGRARNLEEAILWHGGEAEESRRRFMTLSAEDRQALIRILMSI